MKNLKDIEMIPLYSDYMFKKVFMENPKILMNMLISVLKLDIKPELSTIRFMNTELTKSRRKEYKKTVDILVSINDTRVVDVEINTEKYSLIRERNTFYIEKIISMGVEESTEYKDMSHYYFYQLNLNIGGTENNFKDKYFSFRDEYTNEVLTPNIKIIYKSLDYYKKIYYNNHDNINEDVLWMLLIQSKDFDELITYAKKLIKDEDYNKFIKSVRDGSMDGFSIANWESDKMEALVRRRAEEEKRKDALERERIKEEKKQLNDEKKQISNEKKQISDEKKQINDEKKQINDEKKQMNNEKKRMKEEKNEFEEEKKKFEEKKNETEKIIINNLLKIGKTYLEIKEITGVSLEKIKEIKNAIQE